MTWLFYNYFRRKLVSLKNNYYLLLSHRILIVDDDNDTTTTFKAGVEDNNKYDVNNRIEVYTSNDPDNVLSLGNSTKEHSESATN